MNINVQTPHSSRSSCGCGGTSSTSGCGCGSGRSGSYLRPRFFAGQLLTEEDLQTLSDYVIQKNRLHNRHLMGSGVVCGLDVTCHPCGEGKIIVHPGYALDCCGNDIVLSCKEELDVNALVRDLRQNLLGGYDCGDPCREKGSTGKGGGANGANKKGDDSLHYCLYVRYYEEETDPITPYASDEPCGQAVCEPSRIREGYRFELRCREENGNPHNFVQRVIGCLGDLTGSATLIANLAALVTNPDAAAVAAVKEDLLDHLDRSPDIADCALRAYVQSVAVPSTGTKDFAAAEKLIAAYIRLIRNCICAAINPPCPPCDDPGVLLACLEVKDCAVVDICNLERTFVLTAPAFRYWYGILVDQIGELLESACCEEIEEPVIKRPTPPIRIRPIPIDPTRPVFRDLSSPAGIEEGISPILAEGVGAPPPAVAQPEVPPGNTSPFGGLDLTGLFKSKLKGGIQEVFGLSQRDLSNLKQIYGSLGELTNHGVFDGVVPGLHLVRNINLRAELPKVVGEKLSKSETVHTTVGRLVDDRVDARLAEMKKGSEKLIAAEVEKRVNELIPESKLAALDVQKNEIETLKYELNRLTAKLADVKDKPANPKGRPK